MSSVNLALASSEIIPVIASSAALPHTLETPAKGTYLTTVSTLSRALCICPGYAHVQL